MKSDRLRSVVWASELTDGELERASAGVTERRYPKGGYICHKGDKAEHWTGIITGLAKMSAVSRGGKAITFTGIGAGAWFGEGTVLKGEARKYDVEALRETHLLLMHKTTFQWLCENSVGFNRFLVRQLNERLAMFIAATEYDRLLAAEAKVARHLAWLCNPILNPDVRGRIEITQEELSFLAAVSRQTVNRSLQLLEASRLIRTDRGTVEILDLEKLAQFGS